MQLIFPLIVVFSLYFVFSGIMRISQSFSEEHYLAKALSLFFALGALLLIPLYLNTNSDRIIIYLLGLTTNYIICIVIYIFVYWAIKTVQSLGWLQKKQ